MPARDFVEIISVRPPNDACASSFIKHLAIDNFLNGSDWQCAAVERRMR
jgi:hypothetical protein